jgi:hypothetical protein
MQMSQQWIHEWIFVEFIKSLHYFLGVAEADKWDGFMCCPYDVYKNKKHYSS